MSGPNTKPAESISQQQLGLAAPQQAIAGKELGFSESDRGWAQDLVKQGLAMFQPGINFQSAIASGDRSKMVAAAAPMITEYSQQGKQAREQSYQMPRGAGQEFARAIAPQMQANAVAGALGQAYTSSFDKLAGYGQGVAGVGEGVGNFSLAELSGGLKGYEGAGQSMAGAAQTQNNVMQAQAARKQAQMGFLGSVVGAAGNVAGAAVGKP